MAVRCVLLLVVLALTVLPGYTYDLSGIRVDGNKFVNHANQPVILMVRKIHTTCIKLALICYVRA